MVHRQGSETGAQHDCCGGTLFVAFHPFHLHSCPAMCLRRLAQCLKPKPLAVFGVLSCNIPTLCHIQQSTLWGLAKPHNTMQHGSS